MTRHEDGTTTIIISIADQAQLHGALADLRDIGAVITELHITDGAGSRCEHASSQLEVADTQQPVPAAAAPHRWTAQSVL